MYRLLQKYLQAIRIVLLFLLIVLGPNIVLLVLNSAGIKISPFLSHRGALPLVILFTGCVT